MKSKFKTGVSVGSDCLSPDIKSPSRTYNIGCGCQSNEHTTTIIFEYDKDFPSMDIIWYVPLECYCYSFGFWYRLKWKIRTIFKVIFQGGFDITGSLFINETEHLENIIEALKEGQTQMKEVINKIMEQKQ